MKNRPDWMMFALIMMVLIVVLAGFFLVYMSERNQSNNMRACVEAGGEWKRDFGNYYECVRE